MLTFRSLENKQSQVGQHRRARHLCIVSLRWRRGPGRRMRKSYSRSAPSSTDGTEASASGRSGASVTSRSSITQSNISTASWWDESRCWKFVPTTSSHRGWNSTPWMPQLMHRSGLPQTTQVHVLKHRLQISWSVWNFGKGKSSQVYFLAVVQ